MRTARWLFFSVLLCVLGCPPGGDAPLVGQPVQPELSLEVTSPVYGEFVGWGPAIVEGRVHPPQTQLWVEDVQVHPESDGSFLAKVPMDHGYRIVDVLAVFDDQEDSERIPIFAGNDPADTWTEGLTGRLLPEGLEELGTTLGAVIDAAAWADLIAASLPIYESDLISMVPVGVTHSPTDVALAPAETAIDATLSLNDVTVEYELWVTLLDFEWTVPMSVGFGQVTVHVLATPAMDEDGIVSIALSGATIALDEADVEVGTLEGWILEWVTDTVSDWVVEPLGQLLLEWVLAEYGYFELGGPFAFETDLMGFEIGLALADLFADLDGVALGAGIGLGEPAPEGMPDMPVPDAADAPDAQLALALHEGMLDLMLSDTVLDLLDQELDLSGSLGELIGAAITNLPGGEDIPPGDGWCFSIWPGTAHVVRLQEGTEPLAVMYLPDLKMDVQRMVDGECENWLFASLAVEAGIQVEDGTKLSFDLTVTDGAVIAYKADPENWTEDEVIAGLADFLENILSLVGGMIEFDLADLLGGQGGEYGDLLANLSPAIVDSTPMTDDEGEPIEGLYTISLNLFDEGAAE